MAIYYSQSTGGFYDDAIHKTLPEDAVEISAEIRQSLLDGQSQGKRITAGDDGYPVLADEPQLSEAELLERERGAMVVSRFQAIAALHVSGRLAQVKAFMAGPETDPLVVIAFNEAQTFRRTSPTIQAVATELNLTDEQVDDLFRMASTIDA